MNSPSSSFPRSLQIYPAADDGARTESAGEVMMGTRVLMSDLLEGFEFTSSGEFFDAAAYVSLGTGVVYLMGEGTETDDDPPADLRTSDRYLAIPTRRDLDLGKSLALRFARRHMANDVDSIADCFRHSGAYARFKEIVDRRGRLEQWFEFEVKAVRLALAEWCSSNDLELVDDKPPR
jgi:hypothetical protein